MVSEAMMQILAAVLKQTGIYTAADLFQETGLERSLIHYHMNKWVESGYIEKQGT